MNRIYYDLCEWDPRLKREADYNSSHTNVAEVSVGHEGQWRLCRECAELPRFKKFSVRKEIKRK